jgi:ribosomal-protein-alanine N-acetyltransferase
MILTTERLILREFSASDWPAVLAYQSNPLYLRYYEWTSRTPGEVREFVQMFLAQQQEDPRRKFQLAIVLKATGQLIGNCGIRMRSADAHQADIGFELDPRHWGQGYATEAARAVVQFGFTRLRLHRISSWCIADNVGSARVLEKLGMRQEGRLRENEYFKGRWRDTLLYAILGYEWQAQQHVSGSGSGEELFP